MSKNIMEDDDNPFGDTGGIDGDDNAMNNYLTAEANLMSTIKNCVVSINDILKGIAEKNGSVENNLKNYFSVEDYKNILGMDDEMIQLWKWYAEKIIQDDTLVNPMQKVSFLKQKGETGVGRSFNKAVKDKKLN